MKFKNFYSKYSLTESLSYEEALVRKKELEDNLKKYGEILNKYPKLPNGLTPDSVKSTPEYQAAKKSHDIAFQNLRNFNQAFTKTFSKYETTLKANKAKTLGLTHEAYSYYRDKLGKRFKWNGLDFEPYGSD